MATAAPRSPTEASRSLGLPAFAGLDDFGERFPSSAGSGTRLPEKRNSRRPRRRIRGGEASGNTRRYVSGGEAGESRWCRRCRACRIYGHGAGSARTGGVVLENGASGRRADRHQRFPPTLGEGCCCSSRRKRADYAVPAGCVTRSTGRRAGEPGIRSPLPPRPGETGQSHVPGHLCRTHRRKPSACDHTHGGDHDPAENDLIARTGSSLPLGLPPKLHRGACGALSARSSDRRYPANDR